MQAFFQCNWTIRETSYSRCETVSEEELHRKRAGGAFKNLFYAVDVEWSRIRLLEGKKELQEEFGQYNSLEKV